MLSIRIQELETPRLRLRRLTREDTSLFYSRLAGSEAVTEHMLWKPHRCIEESAASIEKVLGRYDTGESCRWAIAFAETNDLIGIIDLLPLPGEETECTFAYMLGQEFWGQGYGTEALKAVFGFAFSQGIQSIRADHFAANSASGAVMRKVGMAYVETIPKKYEKNGVFHDAPQYRISKADWSGQP